MVIKQVMRMNTNLCLCLCLGWWERKWYNIMTTGCAWRERERGQVAVHNFYTGQNTH